MMELQPSRERIERKLSSTNRPYVTLKAAVSLDGKIATRTGVSQWISGEKSRELAHGLRKIHDGILVGANTVAADDPRLTARLPEGTTTPARIILDSRCRTPLTAKCLSSDGARRIVVTGSEAQKDKITVLEDAGVEVMQDSEELHNPSRFLPLLREKGLETILVEGGGLVMANMIGHQEVDELFLVLSGMVIGGGDAPGWCGPLGIDRLEDAPRLSLSPPFQVGEDIVIHGLFGDFS